MRGKLVAVALIVLAGPAVAQGGTHWISSWGSAQMVPTGDNALKPAQLTDATLRQTVHLSAGGSELRVRFSNALGTQPLVIDAAGIARATATGAATVVPGTARPLRFGGRERVLIPAGAEFTSDPVTMAVPAGGDLAVTIHLPQPPATQTGHPGSRARSYLISGNHVADTDLPGAAAIERWYNLADVEVTGAPAAATVVAIGDSITDGHGVVTDSNGRWTDRLAERMRANATYRGWGVVNAGIGGGRVLRDGLGPNLVARFERDVIARPNVRVAIVLEGINDIGVLNRDGNATPADHAALVSDMTAAYREIVRRAHAHGIAVVGGTVMPFVGSDYYHPGAESEGDRQAVNRFIRDSGTFDAVIDFDRVMRDPAHPERLLPAYDLGDHLHPSPTGYKAMGDAVPLTLLATRPHADAAAQPVAAPVAAVPPAPAADAPAIAFTVDDIPAHGPLPPGVSRLDIVRAFTAALAAHRVPAFGFVNGGFGADDPNSPGVLAEWRRAGLPFGNHTFHHLSLNKTPLEQWEQDVAIDEPVIAGRMAGADWHWLRYPFLDEGDTPAKRDGARAFLKGRGYKIADVTMSFGDFLWNEPYARCMAKGDGAAVASLEQSYLAAARAEALRERARAQASQGRDVPYVLLMHIGAFDAHMLPRLLDLYEGLGFRFVSLPDAQRDPFHRTATDLSLPGPSPTLPARPGEQSLPQPDPALCR